MTGVIWAIADRGASNKGSTNETLTSKLFKRFFIVFEVDAHSIPIFASTITLFASLPRPYVLHPPILMLLLPHRAGDRRLNPEQRGRDGVGRPREARDELRRAD